MAITERNWCDFIIYTEKGVSVERIPFDADFWKNSLLPKLINLFDNCLAPEIASPVHALGIPVRNLRDMWIYNIPLTVKLLLLLLIFLIIVFMINNNNSNKNYYKNQQ